MNATASTAIPNDTPDREMARQAPESSGKVIPLEIEPPVTQKLTRNEPRRQIRYRGESWTLIKRGAGELAKWYLRKSIKRIRPQPFHECLFESALDRATIAAKIKIDAILDGNHAVHRATLQRGGERSFSTVGQFIAGLEAMRGKLTVADSTFRRGVNLLRLVLRETLGEGFPSKSLAVLNGKTSRQWIDQRIERAGQLEDRAKASKLRSIVSEFRQVSALFQPWILQSLTDQGIELPDFAEFLGSIKKRRLKCETFYFPPPPEVIEKTLHAWLKLPRNEFMAVGLSLACGLRKSEIQQVTAAMITHDEHGPALRFQGEHKSDSVFGQTFVVRPIQPFWRLLLRGLRRDNRDNRDNRLLEGSDTMIAEGVFNNISQWLRGLGWDTQKTNHALRAYAGGLVIARSKSIYTGSSWLRHESVTTTERHYRYFVKQITDNFRLELPGGRGKFAK